MIFHILGKQVEESCKKTIIINQKWKDQETFFYIIHLNKWHVLQIIKTFFLNTLKQAHKTHEGP